MTNLIKQEIFKIFRKKSTIIIPIILFCLMFVVSIISKNQGPKFYISSAFAGFQWVSIITIIISASSISEEFQYGTIKKLIYQVNSRSIIYISKLIVVLCYNVYLHILAILFTVVLKILLIGNSPSFSSKYIYGMSLFQNLILNSVFDFIGSFMIVTSVFLIASLTNTGSSAIAFGLGLGFLGQGISSVLNSSLYKFFPIEKWNPFNMLNITNQLSNPDYISLTHLSINDLSIGNLIYTLLFILIGIILFSKRRV